MWERYSCALNTEDEDNGYSFIYHTKKCVGTLAPVYSVKNSLTFTHDIGGNLALLLDHRQPKENQRERESYAYTQVDFVSAEFAGYF